MENWHSHSAEKIFDELNSSKDGLSSDDAAKRLEQDGPNELKEGKKKQWWQILLEQFKDIMILILVGAAIVSFVIGEQTDSYVILAIIIGNAIIGYVQEFRAEKSIQALKQMAAQEAIVLRNGKSKEVAVKEIVKGDVVILEAGDIVPADARLFEVNGLKTEEAALTGESEPVAKKTSEVEDKEAPVGDRINMVYKGTILSSGNGKAVVIATGMDTEMGKIAGMLEGESLKTPLQMRLSKFSKKLAIVVVIICGVVFGLGMLRGEDTLTMFLTALSLAVAALPEALPAVVTIALAQGASRMVKQDALIRKLPAVETLGSVTYICSDKTGTLTQNKMTVTKLEAEGDKEELLQHSMLLNNEVKEDEEGKLLGDPTETGMVEHAKKQELSTEASYEKFPQEGTVPFDSERMLMSTLHKDGDKWRVFVKGAPGKVLEKVNGSTDSDKWEKLNKEWAADGLRVLFFAEKELDSKPEEITEEMEENLQMLGAVGMIDPPREEVIDAIKECKDAGIKVVMITGDQPVTAKAIAKDLDIADDDAEVLTGKEMSSMSDEEISNQTKKVRVYARVSPEQKVRIVESLQNDGQFVAMTGDGVNDAPSLKRANIGIAMGVTGTDVAKETAHMILLDDNFATIVKAVREGRRIYDNIKKFILYVLASNLGEILTLFIAPLVGLPIPLLPIHILWINLVTDGLPGLALAMEPAEKNIMQRPPIPPEENLFARGTMLHIILTGSILGGIAIAAQFWAVGQGLAPIVQQTIVFNVLCFGQLLNALSVRSAYRPITSMSLFSNPLLIYSIIGTIGLQFALIYVPFLQKIFKTTSLSGALVGGISIAALVALVLIEIVKKLYYSKKQMQIE